MIAQIEENEGLQPAWLAVVQKHVESLEFGTVQVVVHESQVVQIETTEKVRFDRPARRNMSTPVGDARQP